MTLAYASPEEIDGTSEIGPPADAYSLGATLLHLALGRPLAFAERAAPAQLDIARLGGGDDVRRSLVASCVSCLAFAPSDRPTVRDWAAANDGLAARLGAARLRALADDDVTVVRQLPIPADATVVRPLPPPKVVAPPTATAPVPAPVAPSPDGRPTRPAAMDASEAMSFLHAELRAAMSAVLGPHRAADDLGLLDPLDELSPLNRPRMLARARDVVLFAVQRAGGDTGWEQVDGLVLPVSWLAPYEALADADDSPAVVALLEELAAADEADDGVEIAYGIGEWTEDQFAAITNTLTARGIEWYLDGPELFVDRSDEALVDAVIVDVTGTPPTMG